MNIVYFSLSNKNILNYIYQLGNKMLNTNDSIHGFVQQQQQEETVY